MDRVSSANFWKNIDIDRDLELCSFEFKKKMTNCMESTLWIRNKKANEKLNVILEPMVVKWPKMYPFGNFLDPDENLSEEQKILDDLFQDFHYDTTHGVFQAKSDKKANNQPNNCLQCRSRKSFIYLRKNYYPSKNHWKEPISWTPKR